MSPSYLAGLLILATVPAADAATLVAMGFNNQLYSVNKATGAVSAPATVVPNFLPSASAFSVTGIAQASDGTVYLSHNPGGATAALYRLNMTTNGATFVGNYGLANVFEGDLAFNPGTGVLLGAYNFVPGSGIRLTSVNTTTGAASGLASFPAPTSGDMNGLAFSSTGTLYSVDAGGVTASVLRTLNPTTGAQVSSLTLSLDLGGTGGMAFDPDTGVLYIASYLDAATVSNLYTVNLTTGLLTLVGQMLPPGPNSRIASLAFISTPPTCGSSDFDGDGDAGTDLDIEAFFACMGGDCCGTCGSPDFDGDGDSGTDLDIESFFRVLGGGPC